MESALRLREAIAARTASATPATTSTTATRPSTTLSQPARPGRITATKCAGTSLLSHFVSVGSYKGQAETGSAASILSEDKERPASPHAVAVNAMRPHKGRPKNRPREAGSATTNTREMRPPQKAAATERVMLADLLTAQKRRQAAALQNARSRPATGVSAQTLPTSVTEQKISWNRK